MFRTLRGTAVALLAVAAIAVGAGPAAAAPTPVCTGTSVVTITGLAFNPDTVVAGQPSTATLAVANCTAQTQQVTATWLGRFVGADPGVPPGCPVMDPLPRSMTLSPYSQVFQSVGYVTFAGCTASALQLTVRLSGPSGTLATRTATLAILHPSA